MANKYRDTIVQRIKEAGQELVNRAESMVLQDVPANADFDIAIHIHNGGTASIEYSLCAINPERRIQCPKSTMNIWKTTDKL